MIQWISENYVNILIILALLLIVGLIIRSMIKGKHSCSACSACASCAGGCHGCSACSSGEKITKKDK